MSKIAKNASKLNAVQLEGKVQVSLSAIAAAPATFTGATALLATGDEKVEALEDSIEKVSDLETRIAAARSEREEKRKEALSYYGDLAYYVEGIAKGRSEIIILAGMDVAPPPGPAKPVGKVQNNKLTTSEFEQKLIGSWKSDGRSRVYEVQITDDPNDPAKWKDYGNAITASIVLENLPSGQKRWTRVRGVNSVGPGPWSDPACAMVP